MRKKLMCLLTCAVLVAGLAATAQAFQVKVGAEIVNNIFYAWRSGNSYGNNDRRMPDLTTFVHEVNGDSNINFSFTSNDKTTGAYVQFSVASGPAAGAANIALDHAYGWYKFGRCTLTVGHTDTMFASEDYAPYAWLASGYFGGGGGGDSLKCFGKNYSGRFALIKLDYEVGPWTFQIALGQSTSANADNPNGIANVANTMYPRVDLTIQYAGKWFALAPGISFYTAEHEPMDGATISDDRIVSYALVLPFKVTFGSFGIVGEVGYGRNYWQPQTYNPWVTGLYWGGNNDNGVRIKLEDTYFLSACLGLYYEVGRVTLWLSGGWVKATNDSNDQDGTWRHGQNVRYAVVLAAPYQINKHFSIAPEIGYYSFGYDPTQDVGGSNDPANPTSVTADLGSAWLAGVRMVFSF